MTEDPLVWEDPPPKKKGGGGRREAMRAHPGKWLLWAANAKSSSATLPLRAGGFETTVRANSDGTWRIYARWPEMPARLDDDGDGRYRA